MAFGDKRLGVKEKVEQKVIHRIVEVPEFKTVEVEKAVFKDKEVINPVLKEKIVEVERPVFKDKEIVVGNVTVKEEVKIVEVPKYVEKVVEVPKYVEKIVEVPKYVENIITVDKVEVVPKIKEVEVIAEKVIPKVIEKEFILDKPKFRTVIIDIIKPKYKCQECGHEVT